MQEYDDNGNPIGGTLSATSNARIISPEDSLALGDITRSEYEEIKRNIANTKPSVIVEYDDNGNPIANHEITPKQNSEPTIIPKSALPVKTDKTDNTSPETVEKTTPKVEGSKEPLTRDAMGDWLNMGLLGVAKGMTEGKPVKSAIKDAEWNPYTITRQLLSNIPAAVASGASALGAGVSAPSGAVVDNMLQSAKDTYSDAYTKGTKGEGVEGFVSDPTNLSVLIPGVGAGMKAKGVLGGLVKYGLIPAAESAAITAASDAINPDRDVTLKDELISAGAGGAGGIIGRGMQKLAVSTFPGKVQYRKALRAQGDAEEVAKEESNKVIENLIKDTNYPGTRNQFVATGENKYKKAEEIYDKLMKDIDPELIPTVEKQAKREKDISSFEEMLGEMPSDPTQITDDMSLKIFTENPNIKSVDANLKSEYQLRSLFTRALMTKNIKSNLGLTHKEIEREVDDLLERMIQGKYQPEDLKNFAKIKKLEEEQGQESLNAAIKLDDDRNQIDKAMRANDDELVKYMNDLNESVGKEDELASHLDDYISDDNNLSRDELDAVIDEIGNTNKKFKETGDRLQDLLNKSKELKARKMSLDEIEELRQERQAIDFDKQADKLAYKVPSNPDMTYRMPKIAPSDLQAIKKWVNNEVYNSKFSPAAGQKRAVAREVLSKINDLIGKMNSISGKDITKVKGEADKYYKEFKEIENLLEEYGVNSGSSWRLSIPGLAKYTKTGPAYFPNKMGYTLGDQLKYSGRVLGTKFDQDSTKNKK